MFYVDLGQIEDNPYQTRTQMVPAKIAELADGVLGLAETRQRTRGLLQVPSGRLIDHEGRAVTALTLLELDQETDITDLLVEGQLWVQ